MRFYLDHDVSALVCREALSPRGHNCWTASQAGLALDDDDAQTVYAQAHNATLVTHDVGFTRRRREMPFGRHLHLHCSEPLAMPLVDRYIDRLVPVLEAFENITMDLHADGQAPCWFDSGGPSAV